MSEVPSAGWRAVYRYCLVEPPEWVDRTESGAAAEDEVGEGV